MDASVVRLFSQSPARPPPPEFEPNMEKIKRRLLKYDVVPTPKILTALRKKEIQKHNRKENKRQIESESEISETEKQIQEEEANFQTLKQEYNQFTRSISGEKSGGEERGKRRRSLMVGNPWEGIERVRLKELVNGVRREEEIDGGGKENLKELKKILQEDLRWVLEDDIDVEEDYDMDNNEGFDPAKRWRNEGEAIRVLVNRLSGREITEKHWKFVRMMNQSGLQFTEEQMLKIVDRLGRKKSWKQALAVVHWVYNTEKQRKRLKSRFVYTKLLSVLGFARRPQEALEIFNHMLSDRQLYPDMAAYHSIAVTLGQSGFLKELLKVIEQMKQKPNKLIKNLRQKNWDPILEPDVVIYNAILNACVPLQQWKAVTWVFIELRKHGLRPNGATYGLTMEVMLESGKYDRVYEFFKKMKNSGEAPKAITYKVLVRALWREGKIEEAIEAVRDMEQKGVIGTGSVYYELACCLCNNGRWREAMLEVKKMKRLENCKPLEITFTGLISASLTGGYVDDCVAIFEFMKDQCDPNIGTVNTMIRVYGKNDMFLEAKELFEEIKDMDLVVEDVFTYSFMLEASARSQQWEYFEYVYRMMILSGFRIDQMKHGRMVVEASRAGKWSLLEHAFDAVLEDGEIPNPLFFTEMLCHAIEKSDYQRAIALINTMALASFQISEEQWTDLFEENQEEKLQKLFDYLCDCDDYADEPTVLNLVKSLKKILCASSSSSSTQEQPLLTMEKKPEDGLLLCDVTTMEDENGEAWEFTETELETLGVEELEIGDNDDDDDDGDSRDSDSLSVYDILKEWERE